MVTLQFDPFPVLETKRLLLRQITPADADDIFVLRSNEPAMKYINKPRLKNIEEARELIKIMTDISERIVWAMRLKDIDQVIGTIGYHRIAKEHDRAEIGYMLLPEYWNTGLMSEAVSAAIGFGFEKMNLHSIEAVINPGNDNSRKVLQKFSFIKEGYFKENFLFEGKYYDSEVYSLLKS
jgi:ribosomal-protein-alanine N-acetyltransferase